MKKITLLLVIIGIKLSGQTGPIELINGVYILNQSNYYSSSTPIQLNTSNGIAAYFSYEPTRVILPSQYNIAGDVTFNNVVLRYDSDKKYYSQTEFSDISQKNWQVSGYSSIPAMNFIYNGVLPSFSISQNLIPDTLKKSDTLFVQINNLQHADSVMIKVSDDQQLTSQHHVALLAPNYSNMYYLPPTLFTPLVIGPRAVITIDAINYTYQTISEKRYLFRNIYSFIKNNIIIN